MRIGITYDLRADYLARGYSEEDTAEFDSEATIAAISDALLSLAHVPERVGGVHRLAARLAAGDRWDCVFNFCEGLKGVAREAQAPALLEAYDVPYVFSDPLTLCVALDKSWAKRIVRDCGVPTAPFAVIESTNDISAVSLPYPLFLKPMAEGSGKGIGAKSKVGNRRELESVAAELLRRFEQPVLAEQFLSGREFTVGITGTGSDAEVLGVMEVLWTDGAAPHGYGYENKEHYEGRMDYRLVDDDEAREAARVALAAWQALRCRDGGRIDIRSDGNAKPHFIEVNPLAGLNPERSDLCFIARFNGVAYRDLIGRIMESFSRRHPLSAAAVQLKHARSRSALRRS
ncbi:MAG TPA: ATP-grasp domain-containing protein [Rhizomicrobium sp.]|jgi:D-alanine-D-alanine ligase|nr:ATP-grasp domain-containing protein [Rhizomicrobium sp.]